MVAVTGEVDYVTDGERVLSVAGQSADDPGGGHRLRAVGGGGGERGAAGRPAGKRGRRLRADEAGREIAARQEARSFIPAFLDALYQEVQG